MFNRSLFLGLLCGISAAAIDLTVEPDSLYYDLGSDIGFTVRATNTSNTDTLELVFPSSCILNYIVGPRYFELSFGCDDAITELVLPPQAEYSLHMEHPGDWDPVPEGVHHLFGGLHRHWEGEVFTDRRFGEPVFITVGSGEISFPRRGFIPLADSLLLTNGGCVPIQFTPSTNIMRDQVTQFIWLDFQGSTFMAHVLEWDYWNWGHAFFYIVDSLNTFDLELFYEHDSIWDSVPFDEQFVTGGTGERKLHVIQSLQGIPVDTLSQSFFQLVELGISDRTSMPLKFNLLVNPNPFNNSTLISYDLEEATRITLGIYNLNGRNIYAETWDKPAGNHRIIWKGQGEPGTELVSGVYLVSLYSARWRESRKVVILR